MTKEKIAEILNLLRREISPNCYHDCGSGNFVVIKSKQCQLIIKEKSPQLNLYGTAYRDRRSFLLSHKSEIEALGLEVVIPCTNPSGKEATWCSAKLRNCGKDWFPYAEQIVRVAKAMYDKVLEWGLVAVEKAPSRRKRQSPEPYKLEWKGWDEYYSFWDRFVGDWYNTEANPTDALTLSLEKFFKGSADNSLNKKELPEPYYGSGECAQGVIVNLNPGASDPKENAKIYSGKGKLIESFEKDCGKRYSEFARRWSPYRENPESPIPGDEWWNDERRVGWMKRFWGKTFSPDRLFILEACPYHSKITDSCFFRVEDHIVNRVITPAIIAASGTVNKCAVFVGSGFAGVIKKIDGITCIGEWHGTRCYSLYRYLPISNVAGGMAYLLVINGVQGMHLPSTDQRNLEVEKKILEILKNSEKGI